MEVVNGDNWSYKSCKAPVKSSPPTNQHPVFLQAGCPSCHPTNSVKALKGKISHSMDLLTPSSPGGLPTLSLTTKGSCLHGERVAMPLISPLMPVPRFSGCELQSLDTNGFSEDQNHITNLDHLILLKRLDVYIVYICVVTFQIQFLIYQIK